MACNTFIILFREMLWRHPAKPGQVSNKIRTKPYCTGLLEALDLQQNNETDLLLAQQRRIFRIFSRAKSVSHRDAMIPLLLDHGDQS
jgi:hypothetical protein